jgi:uncharacterized protein (TIGR03435 family)
MVRRRIPRPTRTRMRRWAAGDVPKPLDGAVRQDAVGPRAGYLRTNVADATGLKGSYDFPFSFSPSGLVNQARAPQDGDQASDPNGTISLFDALNEQLGLKLETVKRPVPVLVIDRIERKPLEN